MSAQPVRLQEAPAESLRRVPLDNLANVELPTVEYVVADLIPLALVLLGGHGGAGKSILALIVAAHVAADMAFCGLSVKRGRVVFVSLEDPAEIVLWRLKKIIDAYGLDMAAVIKNLTILDGTSGNAALGAEFVDMGVRTFSHTATLEELRAIVGQSVLVVIDNASDAFDGNENDRRQVRAFMRLLAKVGHDAGAAVLLLAHIDKNAAKFGAAGNSYSGSTAWHNSARARLALTTEEGVIVLAMEKNNLGRIADPLHFRWNDHGVLMPTNPAELVETEDRNPHIAADNAAVMRCLSRAIHEGNRVSTGRTGPSNTHAILKTHPDLPTWAVKDKARFWAALTRLDRIGWIKREEYTTASRNKAERWTIGENATDEYQQVPQWAKRLP